MTEVKNSRLKFILFIFFNLLMALALSSMAQAQDYAEYLTNIEKDMRDTGIHLNVYGKDPFQTGTRLSNYYLNEKGLILERDAFFQLNTNPLQTTEHVADFHHRLKTLRAHGNNMLLQLIHAIEKRNEEGFLKTEAPEFEKTFEELIKKCKKDSDCIANKLDQGEVKLKNVLIENFALASQIFKQIPYMHALELNSVYQFTQLIFLEALFSESKVELVEFDLFQRKQKHLDELIEKNMALTEYEKEYQRELILSTVNHWKEKILKRRYDKDQYYRDLADKIFHKNTDLMTEIHDIETKSPQVFTGNLREINQGRKCPRGWQKNWCKNRKILYRKLQNIKNGNYEFIGQKEKKLPKEFWNEI